MKAPSTCRSAASTPSAAGGRSPIRTVRRPSPTGRCAGAATAFTWLALEPVTGRTHQLRVHTSAMGWPIVGDNIYGNGPRFGEPILHLHSREIVIPISKNKEPVRVVAPAPEHMRERLRQVRVERGVAVRLRDRHPHAGAGVIAARSADDPGCQRSVSAIETAAVRRRFCDRPVSHRARRRSLSSHRQPRAIVALDRSAMHRTRHFA